VVGTADVDGASADVDGTLVDTGAVEGVIALCGAVLEDDD